MSEIERAIEEYKQLTSPPPEEWITRENAADLLHVSTQRIGQLVELGKIRAEGPPIRGKVNKVLHKDVKSYVPTSPKGAPKGPRPKDRMPLSDKTTSKFGFDKGQNVVYEHCAPATFGFVTRIPAKVIRFGPQKVLVEFLDSNGIVFLHWTKPENLLISKKQGEKALVVVRYKSTDKQTVGLTICKPKQWQNYIKSWSKVLNDEDKVQEFVEQFSVIPITQNAASKLSRALGGRQFGRLPEFHSEK